MVLSKKYNLILFIFLSAFASKAQLISPTIVASDGGYFTSLSGSVSYTIGEPLTETFSTSGNIVTEGFQQPVLLITNISETTSNGNIYIYPNPVKDEIFLDFTKMDGENYTVEIIDLSGKLLTTSSIKNKSNFFREQFSMKNYDNGIYLFRIIDITNSKIKSFKIIKQN